MSNFEQKPEFVHAINFAAITDAIGYTKTKLASKQSELEDFIYSSDFVIERKDEAAKLLEMSKEKFEASVLERAIQTR